MRAALLLALLVAGAAGARDRRCGKDRLNARTGDCVGYAFFEAFPQSGAGTTSACSTTAPTGAKGETLTFTRTGNATCMKTASGGLSTTGIADGDLVVLSGNVARVEYDSNGTLGLLVESARTNSLLRSQEFDTAAVWVPANAGASSAPVVTANQATAPDGTLTADQIAFPSVTAAGTDVSIVRQTITATAAAWSFSVYLRRASGTSTVYLAAYDNSLVYAGATACTVVGTSWTRCTLENKTLNAAIWYVTIGVDLRTGSGQSAQSAQTIYAWGAQGESPAAYVTSYIPTTAAAATRNADGASFVLPAFTASAPWSTASSAWLPSTAGVNLRVGGALGPAGLATEVFDNFINGIFNVFSTQTTPNNYNTGLSAVLSGRYVGFHDGTNISGCVNGVCAAGSARAFTPLANVTTFAIGQYSSSLGVVDGIVSRICFQPDSPTRCR